MLSFENFVKLMPPSLSELKVTPSFCFAFKIPNDPTATKLYLGSCLYEMSGSFSFSSLLINQVAVTMLIFIKNLIGFGSAVVKDV